MKIQQLREKMENYYKGLILVYCPILGDTVHFTNSGYDHLIFKPNGRRRDVNEQYLKLINLPRVKEVIEKCLLITETRMITDNKNKTIHFFALEFKNTRVIILKRGTGIYRFESVMLIKPRHKSKNTRKGVIWCSRFQLRHVLTEFILADYDYRLLYTL